MNEGITVKYGLSQINTSNISTIDEVRNLASVMGFDSNVEFSVNGVVQSSGVLEDGDIVVVQNKRHTKAS